MIVRNEMQRFIPISRMIMMTTIIMITAAVDVDEDACLALNVLNRSQTETFTSNHILPQIANETDREHLESIFRDADLDGYAMSLLTADEYSAMGIPVRYWGTVTKAIEMRQVAIVEPFIPTDDPCSKLYGATDDLGGKIYVYTDVVITQIESIDDQVKESSVSPALLKRSISHIRPFSHLPLDSVVK